MELTLEERIDWLKNNKPIGYIEKDFWTWKETVATIKTDMYAYCFNHPYYCGDTGMTNDEARHNLLDELNVPRAI